MVETALVAPILFLLIFGILEFGLIFDDAGSMRQGVRDAGRQGAVAGFGSAADCGLVGLTGNPSPAVQRLMCLTKDQSGTGDDLRVRVAFSTNDLATETSEFTQGNGLIICTAREMSSVTGLFAPLINDRHLTAKSAFRIEQTPDVPMRSGAETDPTGENWSWCAT